MGARFTKFTLAIIRRYTLIHRTRIIVIAIWRIALTTLGIPTARTVRIAATGRIAIATLRILTTWAIRISAACRIAFT